MGEMVGALGLSQRGGGLNFLVFVVSGQVVNFGYPIRREHSVIGIKDPPAEVFNQAA
jgi:hypothetical protein